MLTEMQKALRRTGIGSSDIPAIAGLLKWKTPHDVWLDKRGLSEEVEETLPMKIGNVAEQLLADLFVSETAASIETPEQAHERGTLVHAKDKWILGTPDRLVLDAPELLEIKWVGWNLAANWDEQDQEGVPDYVRAQVEWLLEITDRVEAHVPVLLSGPQLRFRIFRIRRNPKVFAGLRAKAERFWHEHVLTGIPPKVDHTDGAKRMLSALHAAPSAEILAAPAEAEEVYRRLRAAQVAKAQAEKDEELARNQMRELVGDAEGIISDTWKATWKPQRGSVSWKDVAEAAGATADEIEAHRGANKRVLRVAEVKAKAGRGRRAA